MRKILDTTSQSRNRPINAGFSHDFNCGRMVYIILEMGIKKDPPEGGPNEVPCLSAFDEGIACVCLVRINLYFCIGDLCEFQIRRFIAGIAHKILV